MPARSFPTQSYRNSVSCEVCNRTFESVPNLTDTDIDSLDATVRDLESVTTLED
jgi:hypothetical protein